MGCCTRSPNPGYRLILQRGDETLDCGSQSRSLGRAVTSKGRDLISSRKHWGTWNVIVRIKDDIQNRGTLTIAAGKVDFRSS